MQPADYDKAFDDTIGMEKGYSDNPNDPGGATMHGITERVARKWGYVGAMQQLPLVTAKAIGKKEYWDLYECDQLPGPIAEQVFDAAYNGGHPVVWLQQAVGAKIDGKIGPTTIAAVQNANTDVTIMRFLSYRLSYMESLKDWRAFSGGWALRIAKYLLIASGLPA